MSQIIYPITLLPPVIDIGKQTGERREKEVISCS